MNNLKIGACLLLIILNFSSFAQSWEQLSDPPFYKHHSNGFGFNGKGYVIEGTNGNDGPSDISNEVWEYSPSTDSWVQLNDFPGPGRAIAIGDDWNGKYYYGFGSGATGSLNDLWEYDPASDTFNELPSCPCIGRTHPAFVAHNDKIYMGSGSTSNGDLDDWWVYDMITQVWTQKQNIPGGDRHHPFQFSIGDDIYVGGGHRNNWLRWNTDSETWTTINNLPQGRVAGSQFSYGNKGFVIGGDDVNHGIIPNWQSFMAYDAQIDEWISLPSLPNGSRWANSSMIIDDVLYFFNGISAIIEDDKSFWKIDLSILDCLPAANLNAINVDDVSAQLFWNATSDGISDTLKWRAVGAADWNIIPNAQAVYQLENLEACVEYEFQVTTQCDASESLSETFLFSTDGCCTNPPATLNNITATSASFNWTEILGADEYTVRWKPVDDTTWEMATTTASNIELTSLTNCSEYELQLKSVCGIEDIDFSESVFFLTKDCGVCIDLDYCAVSEWMEGTSSFINRVQINDFINETGSDDGYGNYATPNTEDIVIGETFQLTAEGGGTNLSIETFKVWIDFNGNGNFENNEVAYDGEWDVINFTTNILIPTSASPGLTRMRIVFADGFPNTPCDNPGSFQTGEAEDYCINIIEPVSNKNIAQSDLTVFPNPFSQRISIRDESQNSDTYSLSIKNTAGITLLEINNFDLTRELDLQMIPSGIYFLSIKKGFYSEIKKIVKY